MEDIVSLRTPRGAARGADASHAAAQFRDAFAGARGGFALGAAHARARGYFHDPDLYPRCRGAVEANLQGPPSASVAGTNTAEGGSGGQKRGKMQRGRARKLARARQG